MGEVFLYNHGGSANHGCEALVRTVCNLLSDNKKIKVLSESPQQDIHYDIQEIADIEPAIQTFSKCNFDFLKAYLHLKKTGDYFPMDLLPYLKTLKNLRSGDVEISIGGDIYCYEDYPKFIKLHELICKRGCKSILLGCSLEKELFNDLSFVEDMRRYNYISARETLTYELLKEAGLDNVGYAPDSAFTLPTEDVELPSGFQEGNTIGINVSPLVTRKENIPGIVLDNFEYLIQSILEKTDCAVALIPHVVWQNNDDRTVLSELYEKFSPSDRVVLFDDYNCMQLKGFISRCRFFIGARTHATIAAYSTCVPTLVLGYSIKSKGIAKDLFGTEENYVIPVQSLNEKEDLLNAFWWLWEHEKEIKQQMNAIMPQYIAKAWKLREKIDTILQSVIWKK